jgi:YD repeat-containing protein
MTMLMAGLAVALALLMPTAAPAQSSTYYDSSTGRVVGRSVTGSDRSTTYYDASGRVSGRASTNSTGTTTVYGPDGRRVGTTVTTTKPQGR